MTIGVNEVKFKLKSINNSYNYDEDCYLDDYNITLTCPHKNNRYKNINFITNCNNEKPLDFTISYYTKPTDSFVVSNYYNLLENKKSITLSFEYTSPLREFPIKVHINGKEITNSR